MSDRYLLPRLMGVSGGTPQLSFDRGPSLPLSQPSSDQLVAEEMQRVTDEEMAAEKEMLAKRDQLLARGNQRRAENDMLRRRDEMLNKRRPPMDQAQELTAKRDALLQEIAERNAAIREIEARIGAVGSAMKAKQTPKK